MNRKELMRQIQAMDLLAHDLHLFLDTHPECPRAFEEYRRVSRESERLKEEYERRFAPLTHAGVRHSETFNWINEPWPWKRQ